MEICNYPFSHLQTPPDTHPHGDGLWPLLDVMTIRGIVMCIQTVVNICCQIVVTMPFVQTCQIPRISRIWRSDPSEET